MSETKPQRARRLLLCAGGGYQVYNLPGLILSLLKHFADDVQVIVSATAAKMTSTYAVEVASRNKVYTEIDERGPDVWVPHIELSRNADLILVYPATASMIGKVANGICDDLITATIMAAEIPVFFVPITNASMLQHPALQRNIAQLREDGYVVLPSPPALEIATREGLADGGNAFPLPSLLMRMHAALRDPAVSRAKRTEKAPPDNPIDNSGSAS